eukprot:TRINITY_DN237_c0_g2_i1.p1 TRINITY_DN237_c0_g2~~TRINITY_DN237_c0_g2_i1.p1  ORF type:complete len:217 (-),score=43.86 TRINITY_DN237_c0_g2_i1:204-854(-)
MGAVFFKNLKQKETKKRAITNAKALAASGSNWIAPALMVENEYPVVLVGGGGVGKSALSIQYISNTFVEEYDPTIEDSYRKQAVIQEQSCMIDILDTAGQEEYAALRDQWMRDREGFIIVFGIDSLKSFNEIQKWRTHILRVKDASEGPIVLVANKSDLEKDRVVSREEIEALAASLNIPFIETSAKNRENVDEVFDLVVSECRRYRKKWGLVDDK